MNRTKFLKGPCQSCGGHLEFPAEAIGTSIDCPHCGKSTELVLAAPPEVPTVPRRTVVWTAITILILLLGLPGALMALKRAEKRGVQRWGRLRKTNRNLSLRLSTQYCGPMTAAKVIEEIKHLAPNEQAEVIQFAVELARTRSLTGKELGELANRLAESKYPA